MTLVDKCGVKLRAHSVPHHISIKDLQLLFPEAKEQNFVVRNEGHSCGKILDASDKLYQLNLPHQVQLGLESPVPRREVILYQ